MIFFNMLFKWTRIPISQVSGFLSELNVPSLNLNLARIYLELINILLLLVSSYLSVVPNLCNGSHP